MICEWLQTDEKGVQFCNINKRCTAELTQAKEKENCPLLKTGEECNVCQKTKDINRKCWWCGN